MHHVGDVKASCSNSCSNQDWHPPSLEVFQRLESKFKRNFQKLPRYHNTKSSTCSLSLWSLSPWILVAGKPWYDRIVHLYHQLLCAKLPPHKGWGRGSPPASWSQQTPASSPWHYVHPHWGYWWTCPSSHTSRLGEMFAQHLHKPRQQVQP